MAHTKLTAMVPFLGFIAWGDINELSVYRDKQGKMIFFPKTWPDKPPSESQLAQRAKYTAAAVLWKALSDNEREQWDLACRRACLCMHGYNLWQHWQQMADESAIRTLERQTKTVLLP